MRPLIITMSLKRPKLFCENFGKSCLMPCPITYALYPFSISIYCFFPRADAICVRFRNVLGTVVSSHGFTATVIGRIRGAGTSSVFFGGLHDALGSLVAFVHTVPILAQPCLRSFFCSGSRFFFRTVFSSLVCHCII